MHKKQDIHGTLLEVSLSSPGKMDVDGLTDLRLDSDGLADLDGLVDLRLDLDDLEGVRSEVEPMDEPVRPSDPTEL
jgi:hypothetical protein